LAATMAAIMIDNAVVNIAPVCLVMVLPLVLMAFSVSIF
jgi:hypothetical protein